MAIRVNSPGWRLRATTRGGTAASSDLKGLPPEFLTDQSRVADEATIEAAPTVRGRTAAAAGPVDITVDVEPTQTALLALRHPSGALTFHRPVESTTTRAGGPAQVRFQVSVRPSGTRGLGGEVVKAIVVKVTKLAGDRLVSLLLPKLVAAFESRSWTKRGLKEGWFQITPETVAAKALKPAVPVSPERSLLFIHGTFSNAADAFHGLGSTNFFERIKPTYGDRLYAFNHFTLQRTPEENARQLLEGLPQQATTFDVITHSRGGLVLRTLVERAAPFGALGKRFKLGRAVLVASPNNGTPLATPDRWEQTVGWIANLLEMFPDNPFTIGGEFVANGIVWIANHASGDIPGLHAMDGDGDPIHALQTAADPPTAAYSALVANYNPSGDVIRRLLDAGLDQFFGSANDLVVPSEDGWRVHGNTLFVPSARIGCFGPGGNLPADSVTHVDIFPRQESADFLVNALEGRAQPLPSIDPRRPLPDRRLIRGAAAGAAPAAVPVAPPSARVARRRAAVEAAEAAPLRITVTNGDLSFVSDPLMLGHYASTELTGTEHVMDGLIGGSMRSALQLGVYPLAPGSHEVFVNGFINPRSESGSLVPRPKAVIVVGLGVEGSLEAEDLVKTVRLGVVGWARRMAEERRVERTFSLTSALVGSGGTGISAGQSAQLIARGVLEANRLLANGTTPANRRWPQCTQLQLIELYMDRAAEAWRALQLQQVTSPSRFSLDDAVAVGDGGHLRPSDSAYRGAPYDLITVDTRPGQQQGCIFEFNLDTRRARSEVRGKSTQSGLLEELVASASNDQSQDQRVGRTLANLLLPIELEGYLAATAGVQMSLDLQAAAIPWELLDLHRDDDPDDRPWAIRVRLLRRLKLEQFRERVVDADQHDSILVIGEPDCKPEYPRLEGARQEALRVHQVLSTVGGLDESKLRLVAAPTPAAPRPDAQSIINALFEKTWRIVHIAGHGVPGSGSSPGGVVLSNDTFLGPDEIKSMREVPELVFVNCCYLAQLDEPGSALTRYDRARFASGVAGALIEIGVRCVVAAGWAVDDDAAADFAGTFYQSLLQGARFIDAIGDARHAAWERHRNVNTWAAYQCYGDPDWRYRKDLPDANRPTVDIAGPSRIATHVELALELDRIFVDTKYGGHDPAIEMSKLEALDQRFGKKWGRRGDIAEAFGRAYAETGALDRAIAWYESAVNASDGRASMRAGEQLANTQSRMAWELVDRAIRHRDEMRRQEALNPRAKSTGKARADARAALRDADRRVRDAVASARPMIAHAVDLLRELADVHKTMERQSLVGSAIKRRAMVNTAAGDAARIRRDLRDMRAAYAEAVRLGRAEKNPQLHYPASNFLAAGVALAPATRSIKLDRELVTLVERHVNARLDEADFWSIVTGTELKQYQAIASRSLARHRRILEARYKDLHVRATSRRMWSSVYDNAWLVLAGYARRGPARERPAAAALLDMLRGFAHPNE